MRAYIRHHHVALLALFIALGGTSYAAVKLPANSVTTKQVKNRSLLAKDFKKGQLPRGLQGLPGAIGPVGPTGAAGANGTDGAAGAKGDTGDRGAIGPSVGWVGQDNLVSMTPEPSLRQEVQIGMPSGGSLFATFRANATYSCDAGSTINAALFLDGVPVPGSALQMQSGVAKDVHIFGVSQVVAAGNHTLTFEPDCTSGTANASTFAALSFGGVITASREIGTTPG